MLKIRRSAANLPVNCSVRRAFVASPINVAAEIVRTKFVRRCLSKEGKKMFAQSAFDRIVRLLLVRLVVFFYGRRDVRNPNNRAQVFR